MPHFLNTNTIGKQIYKAFSYRLYLHKLRQLVSLNIQLQIHFQKIYYKELVGLCVFKIFIQLAM